MTDTTQRKWRIDGIKAHHIDRNYTFDIAPIPIGKAVPSDPDVRYLLKCCNTDEADFRKQLAICNRWSRSTSSMTCIFLPCTDDNLKRIEHGVDVLNQYVGSVSKRKLRLQHPHPDSKYCSHVLHIE